MPLHALAFLAMPLYAKYADNDIDNDIDNDKEKDKDKEKEKEKDKVNHIHFDIDMECAKISHRWCKIFTHNKKKKCKIKQGYINPCDSMLI